MNSLTHKVLTGRHLIVLIMVAVGLIAGQPWLWNTVRSRAELLHGKQNQVDQLKDITTRIQTIDQIYQKKRSLLDQLLVVFPRLTDAPQVVEQLEHIADEQHVTLTIRSLVDPVQGKKSKSRLIPLPVIAHVEGDLPQLLSYLEAIEHIQQLTAVRTWSVALGPTGWAMDLEVLFYIQPPA